MRTNTVKTALRAGGTAIGTMVFEFRTPGISRIAAHAGADFIIFDTEHSGWTWETVGAILATSRDLPTVPIVRVPATERSYLSRPLDLGAMGLMIPMVESAAQAADIVRWSKYPLDGVRGAAFGVSHDDYIPGDNASKMRSANAESLLIAQIETVDGAKNLEAIAATPGIDVLWMGHHDLTNSMGIPGQFDHPDYLDTLKRLATVATEHGKSAGIMVPSADEGLRMLELGYRCLAYSGDIWIYAAALAAGTTALRHHAESSH